MTPSPNPHATVVSPAAGIQAAPYTDRFVEAGGLKLHYLDYGTEGRTPLICLHGGAVNAHWFDFVAPGFTADYHMRSFDQRGHGDSEHAQPPDYKYTRYAADLAEVVEKWDLRDFVLMGHSMGGLVSLVYSATYPGRVKKLILIDSTLMAQPDRISVLHEIGGRPGRSYASRDDFATHFRVRPAGTSAPPEMIRYLGERSGREGPDGQWRHKFDRNVYSSREFFDIPPHWNRIEIPVLYVKGGRSDRFTPEIRKDALERCPHLEIVEVPGADHHVTLDNPEGFMKVVRAFLAKSV